MQRPSVTLPLPNPASNTSYNSANQMLSFNDKNIVYDNNGNMSSVTNTCGTTNYTWDIRNRLVGINGFNTDCSSLTASFKYDALNRRIEKTINGVTTKYLYDGLDIIQELNQDGTIKANYIRTLNVDEPLARITQNAVRFYVTDALGSVIALTDENGVVKTTYSYDPFGNVTVSGESSDNPFQYSGRENDNTGLYAYRMRYYSPELQRFISEDPIGLAGGDVNLYSYVWNRPTMFIDPLGLWYTDINLSFGFPFFLGFTGGVIITDSGFYPYIGGGIVTPGVGGSATVSSSNPSTGWNIALQVAYVVAGQVGYSFKDKNWFGELGIGGGVPTIFSGSLAGYYVFDPFPLPEQTKGGCKK